VQSAFFRGPSSPPSPHSASAPAFGSAGAASSGAASSGASNGGSGANLQGTPSGAATPAPGGGGSKARRRRGSSRTSATAGSNGSGVGGSGENGSPLIPSLGDDTVAATAEFAQANGGGLGGVGAGVTANGGRGLSPSGGPTDLGLAHLLDGCAFLSSLRLENCPCITGVALAAHLRALRAPFLNPPWLPKAMAAAPVAATASNTEGDAAATVEAAPAAPQSAQSTLPVDASSAPDVAGSSLPSPQAMTAQPPAPPAYADRLPSPLPRPCSSGAQVEAKPTASGEVHAVCEGAIKTGQPPLYPQHPFLRRLWLSACGVGVVGIRAFVACCARLRLVVVRGPRGPGLGAMGPADWTVCASELRL